MNSPASLRIRVRPCTVVYAVLVLLTVVTWAVGEARLQGLPVALLVLLLALVKGQLIGDWFMGLRGRAGIWRWIIALWLFIPGVLIATAFSLAYRS
jgi:cytochrome c oxidase subunit IV